MSKMISVASGFQYSVNIGYDLNNDDKLKNFIPTFDAYAKRPFFVYTFDAENQ